MNIPILGVCKQIVIGKVDPTFIPGATALNLPGLSVLNGPVVIGIAAGPSSLTPAQLKLGLVNITTPPPDLLKGSAILISALGDGLTPYPSGGIHANALTHVISANIPIPPEAVGVNLLSSDMITMTSPAMTVTTNEVFVGNYVSTGTRNKVGAETQTGAKAETGAKADVGARAETGAAAQNATLSVASEITSPTITRLQAQKKDFDIVHPTKEGWRLRHVCIEGPTADVYVRGKLQDSNIIELPKYWEGLVNSETITVSLTPIGVYQELYVEKIEWGNKIHIKNNAGGAINCNYLICAERKDVDKNIPEYEGEHQDYPGNNSEYLSQVIK